VGKKDIGQYAI